MKKKILNCFHISYLEIIAKRMLIGVTNYLNSFKRNYC